MYFVDLLLGKMAGVKHNAENALVLWHVRSLAQEYTVGWNRLWAESVDQVLRRKGANQISFLVQRSGLRFEGGSESGIDTSLGFCQ